VLPYQVIRNHSDYLLQAKVEVQVLLHLAAVPCHAAGGGAGGGRSGDRSAARSADRSDGDRCGLPTCGSCAVVRLQHLFSHKGHLCLVFEMLGPNLYETLKLGHFRGLPLAEVRRTMGQLLAALQLLYQHSIVHCDLKPENVLLAGRHRSGVKLIDLGSSCFEGSTMYRCAPSRAPACV
jgi:serine/threonine protein kinase